MEIFVRQPFFNQRSDALYLDFRVQVHLALAGLLDRNDFVAASENLAFAWHTDLFFVRYAHPSTMSWAGTAMGRPEAGERILLVAIIERRASNWASKDNGT